jgi:hypothetical protein
MINFNNNEEEIIDLDPEEIVEYIFEELIAMGLVTNREYLHMVLDILMDYFIELGLLEDDDYE